MIRRPPRSTQSRSSAASDVYKRQPLGCGRNFGGELDSGSTTLRYRCHVEWPRIGITTVKPRKNGSEPITNKIPTIKPHIAIVIGFLMTARIDVKRATAAPTSRSSRRGKDITLIVSTRTAKRKPTPLPMIMRFQPARVVSTSCTNLWIDDGGA